MFTDSLFLFSVKPLLGVLFGVMVILALFGWVQDIKTAVSPQMTRVLIAQFDPILGAGIASLLNKDGLIEYQIICPADEPSLLKAIGNYQPDAVVMAGQITKIDMIEIIRSINHIPHLRFISVGLNDDLIRIIVKKEIVLSDITEFALIVRNERGEKKHINLSTCQHLSKRA
jgi:CheY-like chemotaxis protein